MTNDKYSIELLMLDINAWNHLISKHCVNKWTQTTHLKIKTPTNYLLTNHIHTRAYMYAHMIGIMVRVSANHPRNQGSIPGWFIAKTQKMVLEASLLNFQNYKVRFNGKWNNLRKRVAPSITYQCSSYWKVTLRVTLDYE